MTIGMIRTHECLLIGTKVDHVLEKVTYEGFRRVKWDIDS